MNQRNRTGHSGGTMRAAAILCLGGAALVAGGYPRQALAVSDALQNPNNGHWYKYVDATTPVGWDSAKTGAESLGGYLAAVTSASENDWILQNTGIAAKSQAWLGATDMLSEGTWVWDDGEAFGFANWGPSEPSDTYGGENWLAMQTDGTWSDESGGVTLSGFIVEWNTDPALIQATNPPSAPGNLVADYKPGMGVVLTWNDKSSDEGGFLVERMPAGFSFSERKSTDANVSTWTDFALYPSETFTYRVAAFNSAGVSGYSNEVSITTSAAEAVPGPPTAPSGLAAVTSAAPSIELSWLDNSEDETRFDLERAAGGEAFERAANLTAGTSTFSDTAVHPGWPYKYRVRALGLSGPSAFSNTIVVTVPSTLDLEMATGTLTHSSKPGRDSMNLAATLGTQVPGSTIDPVADGLHLQFGPAAAPVAVSIPAHDAGWKLKTKKGKVLTASWKSGRGVLPKLSVTMDLVRGKLTVTATGANFSADPTANMRLLFACGANCGSESKSWAQGKPGVLILK